MSQKLIQILGTSSQVPTRTRNQGGYFLRWENQGFLFDPGEGTQQRLIHNGVPASSITKIFITHFHGDHCLGLAGILQRISLDHVSHEIEVYFPQYGMTYFHNLKNAAIYHDQSNIKAKPFSAGGIIFENENMIISALELDHTVETWGYRIQEIDSRTLLPNKLQAAGIEGRRVKQLLEKVSITINDEIIKLEDVSRIKKGQSFAFVLDTRKCENAVQLAKDVDMFVCESTYLSDNENLAYQYGHLTAAEAAQIASDANAGTLVLTHYSQRYTSIAPFFEEASRFHTDVIAANDGDLIEFPANPRDLNTRI